MVHEEDLELPAGRPAGQEIQVTYSYDVNQTMKCSFVDVATGRKIEVEVAVGSGEEESDDVVNKFIVE